MAALTSVTLHSSSSSTLHPKSHSTHSNSTNETNTCRLKAVRFSSSRLFLRSIVPSGLRIRGAGTKPAKSPAEEDRKIKHEYLLQKKVRSVDVKEALRLQKENNFVILDVRPEAEFKEVTDSSLLASP